MQRSREIEHADVRKCVSNSPTIKPILPDRQRENLDTIAMHEITFVVFVYNEEKRIERVIRNFISYGKILFVDCFSEDRTVEIANSYGCDVLKHQNHGYTEDAVTARLVKATVTTPWIYWGYCDEMADAATLHAILAAVKSGKYDIVNIARKNYYYGEFCYDVSADRMNRIFKKDSIDFTGNKIHFFGKVAPGARIKKLPLKYFIRHFNAYMAKTYIHAIDRYTDTQSAEGGPTPTVLRLLLSTGKLIIVNTLRGGYKGRRTPVFLIVQAIYYRWLNAMKVYERNNGLDRDAIELKNDVFRDDILRSLK